MSKRIALGKWGEERAAEYLTEKGYHMLERNYRTPYGELDLIAQEGDALVFVEVKTRTTMSFGFPEEAITPRKKQHLIEAAQAFLQAYPELDGDWRIDVIAVQRRAAPQLPLIEHFENALTGNE